MDDKTLQIYRSLDKFDRVGEDGVYDLLTKGRNDLRISDA